ncbi:hypothetical protein [Streptomyces sp. NPDC094437]|uniref:hypothetical protein n=1 Tax=Streptomyces sp. NPDC094437 TaxID=3366060 RepID=UPI00380EE6FA
MTVTWRGAVRYALIVVVVSWSVGAGVDLFWRLVAGDGLGTWAAVWVTEVWNGVFVAVTVVALTLARRLLAPLPRWRVMLVDGSLYLAALLLCAGVEAWAAGYEAPVDSAFVMAIFAMFTLQLPAAWLLCVWRSGSLEVVLRDTAGTDSAPGERNR